MPEHFNNSCLLKEKLRIFHIFSVFIGISGFVLFLSVTAAHTHFQVSSFMFFNDWLSLILSVLVKPTQALYKNSTVFKLRFSLSLPIENLQPSPSLKAAINQKKKYMWKKIFQMWFAGIKLLCNSKESIAWFMGSLCEHRELRYKISILLNVSEEAFEKIFQFKHDLNQFCLTEVLISCWFSFSFQYTDITIAHCWVTFYLFWRPFVRHGGNQGQQSNNAVLRGHNLWIKSFKK